MSITQVPPQQQQLPPTPKKPKEMHPVLKGIVAVLAAGALIGIGAAIGSAGAQSKTVAVPGPTVTRIVPGPTVNKTVPGPTVTKTVPGPSTTVAAPPLRAATGAVIATYNNTGNQNVGPFNVPASGNYTLTWSYWNNIDPALNEGTNFSIVNTGSGISTGLPYEVASSGHGSTEVTGGIGTDSLNVQATGSWTITIKAA